jgi:hypothetical protein
MKKDKTQLILTSCTAALLLLGNAATAQLVSYVDANTNGNTLIAPSAGGGSAWMVQPFGTQGSANDGLWDGRAFGNSATIFQNASTLANVDTNAVRLVTSISGLPLDTYSAFVYFWSDTSLGWRIGASLADAAGQLPLFKPGDAGVTQFYTGADATVYSSSLAVNPFTSSVMIAEGNRRLYQAQLGTFNGTSLDVYIEGDRAMTSYDQRTWYDGIGFGVPEPSALSLVGCALVAFFASRRFKG